MVSITRTGLLACTLMAAVLSEFAAADPIGKVYGTACQAVTPNSKVLNTIYGIENKDTSKAVSVTCPMLLTGDQTLGNRGGSYLKTTINMTDHQGVNRCRALIRKEDGGHYYKFNGLNWFGNDDVGTTVALQIYEYANFGTIKGKHMVVECELHAYSGSGTPPTLRSIIVE